MLPATPVVPDQAGITQQTLLRDTVLVCSTESNHSRRYVYLRSHSRQHRLRRAASSRQPAQHHSGTAAAGCPLPVSMQQMQPALLQPQETCLPACWSRFLMLHAAYDACLRKLRVCAAMHGCTHTVLVSTYSVSVVRHVLPIRIAPKTSSPCCKVAAVDLIGRLCYRLAVTFGAVSREIFMTAPNFLDGIVFKRYEMSSRLSL